MEKIKIKKISKAVSKQKGFDKAGCYGCDCNDACCRYGCHVDKLAYDLIVKNQKLIKGKTKIPFERWFHKSWLNEADFLGGNAIRSKKENGYCVFHLPNKKGCALFELVREKKLSKNIIPAICRLYPISWCDEEIIVSEHIEKKCNVYSKNNTTSKCLFQTQKKVIKSIFELSKNINYEK